jgi:hypothetical protein
VGGFSFIQSIITSRPRDKTSGGGYVMGFPSQSYDHKHFGIGCNSVIWLLRQYNLNNVDGSGGNDVSALSLQTKYTNVDGSSGNDVSWFLSHRNSIIDDGSGGNDVSALSLQTKYFNVDGSGGNSVKPKLDKSNLL